MDTINQVQQSLTTDLTSTVTSTINDQVTKLAEQFLIPSLIVSLVILVVYITRIMHRHKVDKAIFEIRDMLREMKLQQNIAPTQITQPIVEALAPKETTDQNLQ